MMSAYKTETNAALVDTPLFASVWLALFYVLRRSFNARRLAASVNASKPDQVEDE